MYEILSKFPVLAVVFIAIVTVVAIFLFIKSMQYVGMEKIRGYVYELFIKAEHEFKHGENKEKFEYVICLAKGKIPEPFNAFITESLLRSVVQNWFYLCKDLLDDGKMNGTGKDVE
jgi:hypothetical protein